MVHWLLDILDPEDMERVLNKVLRLVGDENIVKKISHPSDSRYNFSSKRASYEVLSPNVVRITSKRTCDGIEIDTDEESTTLQAKKLMEEIIKKLDSRLRHK